MTLEGYFKSFRDTELIGLRNRNHHFMRMQQDAADRMRRIIEQMDAEIDARGLSDQKDNG